MPELRESYDTIGGMIRGRYTLSVYCDKTGCHHGVRVDLEAWRDKFGDGFSIVDNNRRLRDRLRCEKCGTKGSCSFRISPPTGPPSTSPTFLLHLTDPMAAGPPTLPKARP